MEDPVVTGASKNGDGPNIYQLIEEFKELCTLLMKLYLNCTTDSLDIVLYISYISYLNRIQKNMKYESTRLFG